MNKKIKIWQDKEWLKHQYFDNNLSFDKIGLLCGKCGKNIEHWFKKFGLKSRPSIRNRPGSTNINWKGGRYKDYAGYIRKFHSEPHAYKAKSHNYVLEHILVMEEKIGRKMIKPEIVHHLNGNHSDNRPENLMLCSSNTEHKQFECKVELFAKKLLFDNLAPHLKEELNLLFNDFLSSFVNER